MLYLHKSNSVLEFLRFKFSLEHYFKFTVSYLQSVSRYFFCIFLPVHFINSDLNLLPRHQRKYWTEPSLILISSEYCIKESAVITNLSITQLITYLLYDSILSLDCHMALSQILYEISALFTKSIIKADSEIRFACQDLYSSKSCWLSIIVFSPFNSLCFKSCIRLSPILSRTYSKKFWHKSQGSWMELVQICLFEFVCKMWLHTQSLMKTLSKRRT